ncbi:MAG: maleylacetate reductase [Hyphomonadaceae bacterium]|nr:maleylacetate reductase [Hyphomonadaceae bacterium]MBC6412066.1 maleylacetate reductase [Hyphomonadaceae bacterium]
MKTFTYTGLPARVIFGFNTTSRLETELDNLSISRALVMTTPLQAEAGRRILEQLGDKGVGLFPDASMHTPVDVTGRALDQFEERGADGIVSFGGGSTINLGKAIALRNDAPQVVLPTSYAGSEMTPILGQTEGNLKTTLRSDRVLPETVIYDVNHTMTLPSLMTVTSSMNAIAHAVEAMYAENANPLLSLMAEEGVRAVVRALPKLRENRDDKSARYDALYGAWLCATCLGSGGVALHHKLCHVLGGSFNLPHAETHTIVLPHALAYNAPAVPDTMMRMRRATGSGTPAATLFDLARQGGAPVALKDLGMPESGIELAVETTFRNPYYNPRPFERDAIREIIADAWSGKRPGR